VAWKLGTLACEISGQAPYVQFKMRSGGVYRGRCHVVTAVVGLRVHYRREPPRETQFKPGASGNPRGRPRKPKTFGVALDDALARRVTIEEGGRKRKISAMELLIRRLIAVAAKGDMRALQMLFRFKQSEPDLTSEPINAQDLQSDKDIVEAYFSIRVTQDAFMEGDAPEPPAE
jgi:hypothetical protein